MDIPGYRTRIADGRLEALLKAFGAVCVEGPKWCGKTWTARRHSQSEFAVADPSGNFQNRKLVGLDVESAFLGAHPHLIDEWQEFPELWDATRSHVDAGRGKGLYILTGSSTPRRKGVMHGGTGRIATLRMRPMSLWECGWSEGIVSLRDVCEGRFSGVRPCRRPSLRELAEWIVRGGWPGALELPFESAAEIPRAYVRQLAENDIRRVDDVRRDVRKIGLLMRSLARNESTTAGVATLCRDISEQEGQRVDSDTVGVYLDILRRLFVIEDQPAFASNIRSPVRVKQSDKRHFCDPSLACALLKAGPERLLGDLTTFGFLFEALAERDLRIYCEAFGASLFHYQDYADREIDAVVELENGDWTAIEIKLGTNQEEEAADSLLKLRDRLARQKGGRPPSALVVLVGLSSAAYRRKDGVCVVPLSSLRP